MNSARKGVVPEKWLETSRELGDAFVAPVAGAKVKVGGPVVGEIVAVAAGGAAGTGGYVGEGHGCREGIAAGNLVLVGGRDGTGVDEGVDAVNGKLIATKTEH